jgi:CDP-6-deoxy-D-xylo-4-hexulose-3-dehydrase
MLLPIILDKKFKHKKKKFINYLESQGIETRPVISGSFNNQPAAKLYNLFKKNDVYKNAQEIEELGFIIGLHTNRISKSKVKFLADCLLMIDEL